MTWSANERMAARALRWTRGQRRIWLITVALAAPLGVLGAWWPMPTLLVFAALVLSIGTIWSRGFALGAIVVSSLLMLGIASWFGLPVQASLLTKLLIGLFVLRTVLDLGPDNRLHIPIPLIMLVAVLAVSAVFGAGNRFLALQAVAAYIFAPLAYVAVVHSSIAMSSLKRIALIVLGIVVAQLPIVIVQARFTSNVDRIGGTFGYLGGTSVQAVVMALAWTVAVALLFGRKRFWLLPVGLAITVVLLISEAKAGFVFCALGTIVVGLASAIANPKRGVFLLVHYGAIGTAALAALFGGYLYMGSFLPGGQTMATHWLAWMADPSAIMAYLFSYAPGGQAGRLEGARLVLSQSRTMADLLIGRGLGLLSSSALLGQTARAATGFGTAFDWSTSATRSLLETGLLGILLYVLAIASACRAVVRSWASGAGELGVAVGAAAVGSAAIYVAAAFYTRVTTDAIAVLFWCLMGMAVKWGRLRLAKPEQGAGRLLKTESDGPVGAKMRVNSSAFVGAEESPRRSGLTSLCSKVIRCHSAADQSVHREHVGDAFSTCVPHTACRGRVVTESSQPADDRLNVGRRDKQARLALDHEFAVPTAFHADDRKSTGHVLHDGVGQALRRVSSVRQQYADAGLRHQAQDLDTALREEHNSGFEQLAVLRHKGGPLFT